MWGVEGMPSSPISQIPRQIFGNLRISGNLSSCRHAKLTSLTNFEGAFAGLGQSEELGGMPSSPVAQISRQILGNLVIPGILGNWRDAKLTSLTGPKADLPGMWGVEGMPSLPVSQIPKQI